MNYTLPATHEAIQISLVSLALNSENTHLLHLFGRELSMFGMMRGVLGPSTRSKRDESSRCEALGESAGRGVNGEVAWGGTVWGEIDVGCGQ